MGSMWRAESNEQANVAGTEAVLGFHKFLSGLYLDLNYYYLGWLFFFG